jgi:paired amphipathic helix protein Sin3a
MFIQLVEPDDPSVNGDGAAISRWREYLDSYVLRHPTEWLSQAKREGKLFLRRLVHRPINLCKRELSCDCM